MPMANPFLSVVIPAYNEALRISPTLEKVTEFLRAKSYSSELIIVDDGSADSTSELLQDFSANNPSVRVFRNEPNRGKGFSVRRGVLESNGEYVLFTDADLSAPIEEADKLLETLESSGADAAVGSRALDRKLIGVRQPMYREFGGKVFNLFVKIATGLRIQDTQCGMKLFRRKSTRQAFEMQLVEGFGFDPELLFLIKRFGGKIVEVPVRWNDNPATRVRFLRDSTRMFVGLIALRWRAVRGGYPIRSS
jgi:glycosyltransferase involved in cell wall biosynthesis